MSIIWEAKLDNIYECAVVRTGERYGQLTIKDSTGKMLFEKEVELSYGAAFGPDIGDVRFWEGMCLKVVDGLGGSDE